MQFNISKLLYLVLSYISHLNCIFLISNRCTDPRFNFFRNQRQYHKFVLNTFHLCKNNRNAPFRIWKGVGNYCRIANAASAWNLVGISGIWAINCTVVCTSDSHCKVLDTILLDILNLFSEQTGKIYSVWWEYFWPLVADIIDAERKMRRLYITRKGNL